MTVQVLEIMLRELVEATHDCAYSDCYNHDVFDFMKLINQHVKEVIGEDLTDKDIIALNGKITISQAYLVNSIKAEQRKRAGL